MKKNKMPKGKFYNLFRKIHWISSAICLAGVLFFTVTGITLNHASVFEANPSNRIESFTVTTDDIARLNQSQQRIIDALALTEQYTGLSSPKSIEDNDTEFFFDFPFPGGYKTVTIDTQASHIEVVHASNGLIAILNDLHKGRHANLMWIIFIDACSVLILLFCLSGLILLYQHAPKRRLTWPLTGLGLLLPVILALTMYS